MTPPPLTQMLQNKFFILWAAVSVLIFFITVPGVEAASLSIEPTSGTFTSGSKFSVSIFLDTEDEMVNAVRARIKFPTDKLQVVDALTGFSIINAWVSNPTYDNKIGELLFEGVIPSGIYADKGLVSTVTFRARSVGMASIRFTDDSQVILNDGRGTDALYNNTNGIFNIILPPPGGPIVVSETHPNSNTWYSNPNVVLRWSSTDGANGYSYALSDEPNDIPDDIRDRNDSSVVYRDLDSGEYYFHIKAFRNGAWGGVTHFALNIDVDPPADFNINVVPNNKTTSNNPIIRFNTTDAHSGVEYYEYRIIPVSGQGELLGESKQSFFIETNGQQILSLENGDYDIVARAYDGAGNYREVVERVRVLNTLGLIVSQYKWVLGALIILFLLFLVWSFKVHDFHKRIDRIRKKAIKIKKKHGK